MGGPGGPGGGGPGLWGGKRPGVIGCGGRGAPVGLAMLGVWNEGDGAGEALGIPFVGGYKFMGVLAPGSRDMPAMCWFSWPITWGDGMWPSLGGPGAVLWPPNGCGWAGLGPLGYCCWPGCIMGGGPGVLPPYGLLTGGALYPPGGCMYGGFMVAPRVILLVWAGEAHWSTTQITR